MKHIIQKTLKYIGTIVLMVFVGFFLWLQFGIYIITNSGQRNLILTEIDKTPELPGNFIEVYTLLYPESMENGFLGWVYDEVNNNKYELLPKSVAYSFRGVMQSPGFWKWAALTIYINNNTTRGECLAFIMQQTDFTHNCMGTQQAAEFYFKKPLSGLSNDEVIGLISLSENPSLYNPLRKNAKAYQSRFETLKKQYLKAAKHS